MLVILMYTATYAPFRVAFYSEPSSDSLLIFETLVDFLFMFDIIVMFFSPYDREDGSLECRHKKIAKNYFFGALWIDVVASIPTQFFEAKGDEEPGSGNG